MCWKFEKVWCKISDVMKVWRSDFIEHYEGKTEQNAQYLQSVKGAISPLRRWGVTYPKNQVCEAIERKLHTPQRSCLFPKKIPSAVGLGKISPWPQGTYPKNLVCGALERKFHTPQCSCLFPKKIPSAVWLGKIYPWPQGTYPKKPKT